MSSAYLHIGHGKTGTSFIQSSLASSLFQLRDQEVYYPEPDHLQSVASGQISSGNGNKINEFLDNPDLSYKKILFSNENFFHTLRRPNDTVIKRLLAVGITEINILMFIRDPLDHAPSSYQQTIKRGGAYWDIEEFFEVYNVPELAWSLINKLRIFDCVNLTIKNYSSCKNDILGVMSDWLEIDSNTLIEPPVKVVNRSLTRGEVELQKGLNYILGRSGNLLSDPLCNQLNEIKSEVILPSLSVQKEMLKRLSPYMSNINELVGTKDKYKNELVEFNNNSDDFYFSKEQLQAISHHLGRYIEKLRNN